MFIGSNHFGINSYYTAYAADHGFIGLAFTNTSPIMVPTGAKQVRNPVLIKCNSLNIKDLPQLNMTNRRLSNLVE